MKDKLVLKRKRINWRLIVELYCTFDTLQEYKRYYKKHRNKIRSDDRIAYNFLLHTFGRKYIQAVRDGHLITTQEELIRVLKTPWIRMPEE